MALSFGDTVRERLQAQRRSVREFARAVGCPNSQGFFNRVLKGQQPPPVDTLEIWADALGIHDPDEREAFIELGHMESMRPPIRRRYLALKAEVARLRRIVGPSDTKLD